MKTKRKDLTLGLAGWLGCGIIEQKFDFEKIKNFQLEEEFRLKLYQNNVKFIKTRILGFILIRELILIR